MQDFGYLKPRSLAEAARAHQASGDARYLAGGQSLIPVLKQRLAAPADVIDLADIPGLAGITAGGGTVTIGAMTRHADVAASPDVRRLIPALADLAGGIGDPHVRNRGTIGGSLANADPSADYPAGVLGLGATLHSDRRAIPADKFFKGLFETALAEGEIITRVEFPLPERAGYARFPNPASRYAMVGVMVSRGPAGMRVAVTGAGPCAFRVTAMEAALAKRFSPDALDGITVPADGLNSDIHGSAEYRAHLVTVVARRAVARAAG